MVKQKKVKKININKVETEEQEEIRRFIIILIVLMVFILGIYLFTKYVVKKDTKSIHETTTGAIDYNKVIAGNMLNQSSKDYYVFAYSGNSNDALLYSFIIDKYSSSKDSKKVYWLDLDNNLNKNYIASNEEEINKDAKTLKEIKFGNFTLIEVKDGKIAKYIDNIESAKKELKLNND